MDYLFGDNMKFYRTNLNLSFTDLSKLCKSKNLDLSAPTLQRYESGKIKNVPYDSIITLAEIFNCTPCQLMGWETSQQKNQKNQLILTTAETEHIKKYRALDERGKATVDNTLEKEYEFVTAKSKDTQNAVG